MGVLEVLENSDKVSNLLDRVGRMPVVAKWDNRDTWDNKTGKPWDNRSTWDNWDKK
jgi:hypothetical protein